MIQDTISRLTDYFPPSRLEPVLQFLARDRESPLEEGTYALTMGISASVSRYVTRDPGSCRMEAHRKYIDLQILTEGTELVGWSPLSRLEPDTDYDEERDISFYRGSCQAEGILSPGLFMIFFPQDGHSPCRNREGCHPVRKIVFKLPAF